MPALDEHMSVELIAENVALILKIRELQSAARTHIYELSKFLKTDPMIALADWNYKCNELVIFADAAAFYPK